MTGHRATARLERSSAVALAIALLGNAAGTTVTAQSAPAVTPTSGACAGLVELLPQQSDAGALTSTVIAGSDMDASGQFAPLLAATGISADGLCLVFFNYGTDTAATGGLVRFGGTDATKALMPLLDLLAVPCLTDGTCAPIAITVEGRPVTQAPSPGYVTDFYVFGDTIVYGIDGPQFATILAALPATSTPLPSGAAPGRSSAPQPTAVATPASS